MRSDVKGQPTYCLNVVLAEVRLCLLLILFYFCEYAQAVALGEVGGQLCGSRSSFLSFHLVNGEDRTQVLRPGSKCLYLQSHLFGHRVVLFS